jgi:tetratricopeptide (TPR) repeat protein
MACLRNAGVRWALGIVLSISAAAAQNQPGTPTTPGGGTTPGGRTTTPTPAPQRQPQPEPQFEEQPIIFLSGRIMLDDGNAPSDRVVIERVCNGVVHPEAYADGKGRFSFQVGQSSMVLPDASVSSLDGAGGYSGGFSTTGAASQTRRMGFSLRGCELRAALAGYRSDAVSLNDHRALDGSDIGVIVLHRLGDIKGTTVSASDLAAPKDARKAYEKGVDALRKGKWADAQRLLDKAVTIYPKYAAAWSDLGQAHLMLRNLPEAGKALDRALEIDPKFLRPYLNRALIALDQRNWDEAARLSGLLIELDPHDFPAAYYYGAIAHLNLGKIEEAEKQAQEGIKRDSAHRVPRLEYVLGVILANRGEYAPAAERLRAYLDRVPDAQDAPTARKQLVDVERRMVRSKSQPQAAPGPPSN